MTSKISRLNIPCASPACLTSHEDPDRLEHCHYILRERELVLSRFTEALDADNVFVSSDVVDYEIRRYLMLKDAGRQLARYEELSRDWLR